MLDLHNHVLPGLDDGARNLDEALGLLNAHIQDGVQHVVCTPHMYPGVFDNTVDIIAKAFAELSHEVAKRGLPLTLSCAAEVRVCGELLDWLRDGQMPLLGGGAGGRRAVLLELPDGTIPLGTEKILAQIVKAGIDPIIAHPERNRAVMQDPDKLLPLLKLGTRLQLTAGSLLGEFGGKAKLTAMTLLQRGQVDFVASDAHNLGARRPRMKAARAWLVENFNEALAERLTETNPAAVAGVGAVAVTTTAGWAIRDLPADNPANPSVPNEASKLAGWDVTSLSDWPPAPAPRTTAQRAAGTPVNLTEPGPEWAHTQPMGLRDEPTQNAKEGIADAFDLGQLEFPQMETKVQLRDEDAPLPVRPIEAAATSVHDMLRMGDLFGPNEAEPTPPAPAPAPRETMVTLMDVLAAGERRDTAAALHAAPVDSSSPLREERAVATAPPESLEAPEVAYTAKPEVAGPAPSALHEQPENAVTDAATPELGDTPCAASVIPDKPYTEPHPEAKSPNVTPADEALHGLHDGIAEPVVEPDAAPDEVPDARSGAVLGALPCAEPAAEPIAPEPRSMPLGVLIPLPPVETPALETTAAVVTKPGFWARVLGWLFGRTRRDGTPAPLALESRFDPASAAPNTMQIVELAPSEFRMADAEIAVPGIEDAPAPQLAPEPPPEPAPPDAPQGSMPTTTTETETAAEVPEASTQPASPPTPRSFKLSEFEPIAPRK